MQVHVEVFTGGESRESTIGARWQKGVIQEFDSFRFVSKVVSFEYIPSNSFKHKIFPCRKKYR